MGSFFAGIPAWMEDASCCALLDREYETKDDAKIVQVVSHKPVFVVSDREAFMPVSVHGVAVSDDWTPGTLVRLTAWRIQTRPALHLEATVSLIGAQDMGMVGNPVEIRRTVEVRRVTEHLRAQQLAPTTANVAAATLGDATEWSTVPWLQHAAATPELGDAVALLNDNPSVVDALMAAIDHRKPQSTTRIEQTTTQRAAALPLGDAVALLDQPLDMEALMVACSAAAGKLKPRRGHDGDDGSIATWKEAPRNQFESDVTPLRTNATMKMPVQTMLGHVTNPTRDFDDEGHDSNDDDDYEPKGISAMLTDTISSSDEDHDDNNGDNHDKPHFSTDNRKRPAILDARTVSTTPPPPPQATFRQTRQLFRALLDPARKYASPQPQPRRHHRSLRVMLEQRNVAAAKSK